MQSTENDAMQTDDLIEGVLAQIQQKLTARQYCDAGPHQGEWRVHIGDIYLTDDEVRALTGESIVAKRG